MDTKERVVKLMATNHLFAKSDYELFARVVLFLVKKYGVGETCDYSMAEKIEATDDEFLRLGYGRYIGDYTIAQILSGCEEPITAEQQHNRDLIKGVVNA